MKSYKSKILLVVVACVLIVLSACGSNSNSESNSGNSNSKGSSDSLSLKSADVVENNSPHTLGMEKFAEDLTEATDGKIAMKHYPAGQLGSDTEIVEGVKLGSIDMALTGILPGSEVLNGFLAPFIFEDGEHLANVIDSETGDKIIEKLNEETALDGIQVVGLAYSAPRVITTNNKEIKTLDDMKGLKIRVPEVTAYTESFKALGASPTPVAFTELYNALQTGTVEAQENPYQIIHDSSYSEVQNKIIETYHIIPARLLIMNEQVYNSLSDEEKETLKETWMDAENHIFNTFEEKEEEQKAALKEAGMEFIQPDVEGFKDATEEVRKEYGVDVFGEEIYEEIQALRKDN